MVNILIFFCFTGMILNGCRQGPDDAGESGDPHLWLEDIRGEKALDWVRAQNKLTARAFAGKTLFDSLQERFLDAFNSDERIPQPSIAGEYVYNLWQDEQNVRGLWRRMPLNDYIAGRDAWEVVLDVDDLSEKEGRKWVFGGAVWLAPENRYCLVSLSEGGKDASEIREFDPESKTFVEQGFFLPESKGGASWLDNNTLLVSTDFGKGSMTTSGYPRMARKWERGTSLDEAELIHEADSAVAGVWPMTFYDHQKRYAFVYIWKSAFETEMYRLSGDAVQKVDYPPDAELAGFHKNQMILALQADWETGEEVHRAGTLVSFDLDDFMAGNGQIQTIYRPGEHSAYVSTSTCRDFIVVNTLENVRNKLRQFRFEGGNWRETDVETPGSGSISRIASGSQSDHYFFRFSSLITPPTLYHGKQESIRKVMSLKGFFNTEELVLEQFEAVSKDGTHVPYFIVHRQDMAFDGKNPALIWAYGGFNIAEQPDYSFTVGIGWLEKGGVYVLANIRGGGEFGPEWHQSAMKEKRQNAYDDFFAVSEDLIRRKITSPEYLGAFGWSNGGLLAGVAFTQRPGLYEAVVAGAPLLDMKRYSKMLAGASWMGEYGNPDDPEQWAFLKKYSPYHNLSPEKEYPRVLFVTSTMDDRVHPGHARKMAARMKDMGHEFYYHETIEGGHGAASTNKQRAYMYALIYTYLHEKLMK